MPPEAPKKPKKRWIWRLIGWAITSGIIVTMAVIGAVSYYFWLMSQDLPDYEVLARYEPKVMTRVHANDGSLLAEYAKERRIYVPITAMPKLLVNAFIASEDKNFYKHNGIDFTGLARAVFLNVKRVVTGTGSKVGASTITQQVAKNFLLSNEQKISRKVKEAILAYRIERAFTKEQILELYLNEIYFGLRSYGVAAAGLNYFGKSLDELELHEVAYMAGLIKGPGNYHPFRHTQKAIIRRNYVIGRMVENGYATAEEGKIAKAKPLGVNLRSFGVDSFEAGYFTEEVRRELLSRYGEKKLYGGGLSVRTTLEPKLQRLAHKALVKGLVGYDMRHGWRGAVTRIEDLSGDWGEPLAKVKYLSDVKPWEMAVVLSVSAKRVEIGLRPERLKSRKLEAKRQTGYITLKTSKWAKRLLKTRITKKGKRVERFSKRPKKMSDILTVGDVIYVKPTKSKKESTDGKVVSVSLTDGQDGSAHQATEPKEWVLRQIPKVSGGIIVMDPHTGRILALSGGFSFKKSQFNRATQAYRQPGSSFKPFVYATALDNGYTPSSVVLDAAIVIETPAGLWKPKNYGGKFAGPTTLRTGIERSKNLMTVRLAQDLGMPLISEYARRFGVYENLPKLLSMALGAGETTLIRMASGYCILANGGKKVIPTLVDRIQDRYGRTVWRHDGRKCNGCDAKEWDYNSEPALGDDRKQIIDPYTSAQITSMMEGVVQRGTARKMRKLGFPLAGKTGTTNNEKDAWFVGYSPDLVVGAFVGFDNPSPMGRGETGGNVAGPVFAEFMKTVHKGKKSVPFRIPPGMKLIRINRKTGARTQRGDKYGILELFKPNENPPEYDSYSQDDGGGYSASPNKQKNEPSDFFGGLY